MTGQPLALAHRDVLAPLLAARWSAADPPQQTLSDPWFANLYLFRAAHDWRWLPGEWPCIGGHAYDGARLLLPLFDLDRAPIAVLRELLAGHDAFGPLSKPQAERLDAAAWTFAHSRTDADYLYTADAFRDYRGRTLQKKRNLVKQLLAGHGVESVDYTPALATEAAGVLDGWLADKHKKAGDADDAPCREALVLAERLGLDGTLFRVDGRAAGFVLAETIRPGVAVMRFAKGLAAHKGLYQHMFQQFCRGRPALQWLNFEQDLGIPNFRRSKLSYAPAALLDKFRARLR